MKISRCRMTLIGVMPNQEWGYYLVETLNGKNRPTHQIIWPKAAMTAPMC